ncbi:MAG: molybdopterin adenylyltransferase [Anaerovoracaceae bacterium]|jgi:molybdopterin adenylyltransferase
MIYKVGIITSSDKGAAGEREDLSVKAITNILNNYDNFTVDKYMIIPDEKEELKKEMIEMADIHGIDLILTTGGTGFSHRDVTPEATLEVIDRRTPGIPEAMRWFSLQITPRAMLSRAEAGIRNDTLIINLPGSPKAITETLDYVMSSVEHGLDILKAQASECAR